MEFNTDSVDGHHVYKSVWTPYIGETVPLEVDDHGNEHDTLYMYMLLEDTFYYFLSAMMALLPCMQATGHKRKRSWSGSAMHASIAIYCYSQA